MYETILIVAGALVGCSVGLVTLSLCKANG
jgi:NAD/NADP transhydrogenase beta subunit